MIELNGTADIDLGGTYPNRSLESRWAGIRIRIRPDVSPEEAAHLHLEVLNFASDLSGPVYDARMEEKRCEQEARREYTTAFLLSSASSDRKKDADAKAAVLVQVTEAKHAKAEIYRKLLEDMRDDVRTTHYALRAVAKMVTDDKWLS